MLHDGSAGACGSIGEPLSGTGEVEAIRPLICHRCCCLRWGWQGKMAPGKIDSGPPLNAA
jgi:hypothetical protein